MSYRYKTVLCDAGCGTELAVTTGPQRCRVCGALNDGMFIQLGDEGSTLPPLPADDPEVTEPGQDTDQG